MRRREILRLIGGSGLSPLVGRAWAQTPAWPQKPVKIIVPFSAGGPTDTIARLIADELQAMWNSPVLVDYKPGAGTIVGTNFVAKSAPDGYTLGVVVSSHTINPSLHATLPYDPIKDLTGVSQLITTSIGLFANPSFGPNSVGELLEYAKAHPHSLSFATPGTGTATHLIGELLNNMTGMDMTHVPYRGSAPAQQDVIGGRVPLLFDVTYSGMPFVRSGHLKILAVASPERVKLYPDVPTIAETVPGFNAVSIIGVIAPSGTPPELVERISRDIRHVLQKPNVIERAESLGMEPAGSDPREYNQLIQSEIAKWAAVIQKAGIHLD